MTHLLTRGGGLDELGILGLDRAVVSAAQKLPDDATEMMRNAPTHQVLDKTDELC